MSRSLLFLCAICTLAHAAPNEGAPLLDEPELQKLVRVLHEGKTTARTAAAAKIVLAEHADLPLLVKQLYRERKTDAEAFRTLILESWGQVPNPKGYDPMWIRKPEPPWTAPPRVVGKPRVKRPPPHDPETTDWLQAINDLDLNDPAFAALTNRDEARGDALEIIALLRGMSHTQAPDAVDPIFRFAFEVEGAFRDECGRQLRGLSGYAVAPLLRLRYDKSKTSAPQRRRYATYQLDRMDRSQPAKAIAMAPDETIRAATLHAYGEVYAIDAVDAVLAATNDDAQRVRRAARWSWQRYITGNPPEAPKRKRKLGGGKEEDKETPDYLTYRELAHLAIGRAVGDQLQIKVGPPPSTAPSDPNAPPIPPAVLAKANEEEKKLLQQLTDKLFTFYDTRRNEVWDGMFTAAVAKAQAGDAAGAAELFKQILDHEPTYGRRSEMASVFRALGDAALARQDWPAARTAWQWASFLTTDHAAARPLDGRLAYLQVREAGGKLPPQTRAELLQRAIALDPSLVEAKVEHDALVKRLARNQTVEQLLGGLLLAILFGGSVFVWRRRAA